jgi:glyoxylase-like metal-dependent hydrolase (beta-lactamase superfamily II)
MSHYICLTCGVQFAESENPPERCPICEDERQYVNPGGQQWTTLDTLRSKHRNIITELDSGLHSIRSEPAFAIGQQAHLIQTAAGNILWDCISLIDIETVEAVQSLGGLAGIAISHPHFYDSMVEWSHAFGGVPIYLHADDQEWVMRLDPVVQPWQGDTFSPLPGITLIRCGGHFAGSTILHWADGADGQGAIFTADTIMVVPDQKHVSFMYSFPNLVPLPHREIERIVAAVEPFAFDRIYGGWPNRIIRSGAKEAIQRSTRRYIAAITDPVG